jgi:fructokinase
MDIVTLGELLIDMLPAEIGTGLAEVSAFHPKPGGAPANVAIAARRLGAQTAFIGKVGDDAFGYHLRDVLRVEGVDTRGLRFDPDIHTTLAIIAMPDANSAEFLFYRNPGADTRLHPDELDEDLIRGARALHFGSLSLTDDPARSATISAVQIAEKAGALISFDVNFRPSLWASPDDAITRIRTMLPFVNLLKVNEVELRLLADTDDPSHGSRILLDHGPTAVLVTMGAGGSFFRSEIGGGHVPPFRVTPVDAIGSGDAFIGAVLARLVTESRDWHSRLSPDVLHEILRYANAVGALTTLKQGVIPALPTARQVDQFMMQKMIG